jgi:hypothetical protein
MVFESILVINMNVMYDNVTLHILYNFIYTIFCEASGSKAISSFTDTVMRSRYNNRIDQNN